MRELNYIDETIERNENPALRIGNVGRSALSTVYLMDCIAGMKHYPDKFFDLAVVDPPYGIMVNTNPHLRKAKMGKLDWDIKPSEDYWKELFRVSKNAFIFGAQYFELPQPKTTIFWDKLNFNPLFGDGELCFYYGKLKDMRTAKRNLGGVIKVVCSVRQDKIHPTQKPIELYEWILKYFSNKEDKILDTHLGSGSSRIAANKAGLDFVGFEIDREYFDNGNKRFKNFVSQTVLF